MEQLSTARVRSAISCKTGLICHCLLLPKDYQRRSEMEEKMKKVEIRPMTKVKMQHISHIQHMCSSLKKWKQEMQLQLQMLEIEWPMWWSKEWKVLKDTKILRIQSMFWTTTYQSISITILRIKLSYLFQESLSQFLEMWKKLNSLYSLVITWGLSTSQKWTQLAA